MSRNVPTALLTATLLGGALAGSPALADCSQSGGTITCSGVLAGVSCQNAASSLIFSGDRPALRVGRRPRVDAVEDTLISLAPTLEFGTRRSLHGMDAEATFSGGALAFVAGTDRSAGAAFVGVGEGGPGFTVTDGIDELFATLGASEPRS